MSARPGPSGGYHASDIPTGIARLTGSTTRATFVVESNRIRGPL